MFPFLFAKDFLILQHQTIKTGGNRVNSASKKMKKQVLNQLESLIKKFNKENEHHGHVVYEMERPIQYKRGHYSLDIRYTMVYSLDMKELMEFIRENGLMIRLGFFEHIAKPYMEIL